MSEYLVSWYINVTADSHEEAAREALAIQRNPSSKATVFSVLCQDEGLDVCEEAETIDLSKEGQ